MKKTLALPVIAAFFLNAATAFADNFFCATDADFYNMANCILNETLDTCRTLYPSCDIDSYLITAGDPVSAMISLCCVPGRTDAQWDACFLREMRKIKRAKSLPAAFRDHVKATILSYIADAELECTEH